MGEFSGAQNKMVLLSLISFFYSKIFVEKVFFDIGKMRRTKGKYRVVNIEIEYMFLQRFSFALTEFVFFCQLQWFGNEMDGNEMDGMGFIKVLRGEV